MICCSHPVSTLRKSPIKTGAFRRGSEFQSGGQKASRGAGSTPVKVIFGLGAS
jgi:hypothetical protein